MSIARNAPCPCGSGKKYKKCCLPKAEAEVQARTAAALRALDEQHRAKLAANEAAWKQEEREREKECTTVPPTERDDACEATGRGQPDWPPLSAEDQQFVDAWWAEVGPVYTGKGRGDKCGWLLERTLAFLNEQPRLFRHLYLDEEFLFELADSLSVAGRFEDHLALLRRLRSEQPELYFKGFGYYDEDLLTEALRTGQPEDIPACLALFRQHPVEYVDQFATVVDLLAWRGCESALRSLLEPTAATIADSPRVIGGSFGLLWLTNLTIFPFLEAGDDSPAALDRLWREAMAVGFLDKTNPASREWLRRAVQMASPSAAEAHPDLDRTQDDWYASDVAWSFTGWARRTKGLEWTSARFLAQALLEYWGWKGDEKTKATTPFDLNVTRLDHYLVQRCRDIVSIKGVPALSSLQALHYFTEYLVARGHFSGADAGRLQAAAASFYETIRKAVDACDPAYRLYPTYEALIAGGSHAT